jgi:hypothetical protein
MSLILCTTMSLILCTTMSLILCTTMPLILCNLVYFLKVTERLSKGLNLTQEYNIFSLFEQCGSIEKSIESRTVLADVLSKFERWVSRTLVRVIVIEHYVSCVHCAKSFACTKLCMQVRLYIKPLLWLNITSATNTKPSSYSSSSSSFPQLSVPFNAPWLITSCGPPFIHVFAARLLRRTPAAPTTLRVAPGYTAVSLHILTQQQWRQE